MLRNTRRISIQAIGENIRTCKHHGQMLESACLCGEAGEEIACRPRGSFSSSPVPAVTPYRPSELRLLKEKNKKGTGRQRKGNISGAQDQGIVLLRAEWVIFTVQVLTTRHFMKITGNFCIPSYKNCQSYSTCFLKQEIVV